MRLRIPKIARMVSQFNLSHTKITSVDFGKLIPILCTEVLPGDTFQMSTEMLVQLSPLVKRLMHEVHVFTHTFFVPNRLLWEDFENFITGGETGADATTWPYKTFADISPGDLSEYLGLPEITSDSLNVSALPFRAYALIYNEWYRDQNIQTTKLGFSTGNGQDNTTSTTLQSRCWEKDYYTSCLPWTQKGTAVSLPLGTSAPLVGEPWVLGIGKGTTTYDTTDQTVSEAVGNPTYSDQASTACSDANNTWYIEKQATTSRPNIRADLTTQSSYADLSNATAATINELRNAFAIQKFMELSARAGSRYKEHVLAFFGANVPDHRIDRPEYLGGGKSPIVIGDVIQTSESNTTKQGTITGYGISAQKSNTFRKSFTEHGILMTLMSIMPKTVYQQGVHKMWNRQTKYDYLNPMFWNIGEQAVLNQEVYVGAATKTDTFGYQARYQEYRELPSQVTGEMKDGLKTWHMGRIFPSEPSLNSSFVTSDPTNRVFAVTSEDQAQVQIAFNINALRPLPKYAEPGI